MNHQIIGIDPGESCGVAILDGGQITSAFNIMYDLLPSKITHFLLHPNCTVVIEDIRPFSLRLTPQLISTCKLIGELCYRLKNETGANVELVTRNQVKKWVFDSFPEVCVPIIKRKIEKKGYKNESSGEYRSPSFVFVDDRIVTESMKYKYKIPLPKPGSGYMYGLKDHSWQALALASFWEFSCLKTPDK